MLASVILLAVTIWLLYKAWCSVYSTWESRGFPFVSGKFPFGSSTELVTLSEFQGFATQKMYNEMAPHPFFGIYIMRKPILVLRDPEIVRLVMAKEFSHFRDRQGFQRPKKEFLSQHLFNLDGEKWRALRVKLSPTFSSGKLKAMYPIFVNCAEALDELLLSSVESIVDVKDIASRFTSDTICSCAFGLEVNATKNPDSEFKNFGIDIFKVKKINNIKSAFVNAFPFITKIYTPGFTSKSMETFLLKVVKETVEFRRKSGMKRNDFLDLLMQLQDQGVIGEDLKDEPSGNYAVPVEMTFELMTAQCFVFFAAGFETSSSVQSYCLYELAMNTEIQDKLHEEIQSVLKSQGGLNYQAIMDMNYLDMVVHETMRKYPTLPILTRRCTKDFTMPTGHKVFVGDRIFIPVYALHHDPAFFPNPEKFDPERFSPENKDKIKPYAYLPFGEGPRICIGMRFGLLQTKMGLITVLRRYRVERAECTKVPVQFIGTGLITTTEGPIQLKLVKRK